MFVAIVNNNTKKIHHVYENTCIDYELFKCSMGNCVYFTHVIIPIEIANKPYDILECVEIDGIFVIQLDVSKNEEYQDKVIESAWNQVRFLRNKYLSDSDWTQMSDVNLEPIKKEAWKVYRQELRDLPNTIVGPLNVIWPTKP